MTPNERLEKKAAKLYPKLLNRAMARMLASGNCVDIVPLTRRMQSSMITPKIIEGTFILKDKSTWAKLDGKDFCVLPEEWWIWSVGRRETDDEVFFALDGRFYQTEGWTCLWLR